MTKNPTPSTVSRQSLLYFNYGRFAIIDFASFPTFSLGMHTATQTTKTTMHSQVGTYCCKNATVRKEQSKVTQELKILQCAKFAHTTV